MDRLPDELTEALLRDRLALVLNPAGRRLDAPVRLEEVRLPNATSADDDVSLTS